MHLHPERNGELIKSCLKRLHTLVNSYVAQPIKSAKSSKESPIPVFIKSSHPGNSDHCQMENAKMTLLFQGLATELFRNLGKSPLDLLGCPSHLPLFLPQLYDMSNQRDGFLEMASHGSSRSIRIPFQDSFVDSHMAL